MYHSKLQYLKRVLIVKCEIHDGAYEINRIYFCHSFWLSSIFSSKIRAQNRYSILWILFILWL